MVYQGHVHDGRIVLDEPVNLDEGSKVEIRLVGPPSAGNGNHAQTEQKSQRPWLKHVGCVTDFPPNASQIIDEVLYGRPDE